jgi:glycosyltransferase involved in cell wall biosynthesis
MIKYLVITPVFDACVNSAALLINALQKQTYTEFQHILISNGSSTIIKSLVNKVNDSRFIYSEYLEENTSTVPKLMENLGKRRNFCLKNYMADRYFFFDADLQIIDNEFFYNIHEIHEQADVIISKIDCYGVEYPLMPMKRGNIDLANYSISRKMAEKYDYPTEYTKENNVAFDWRFFSLVKNEGIYFSNILYAVKDGNNTYKTVSSEFIDWIQIKE